MKIVQDNLDLYLVNVVRPSQIKKQGRGLPRLRNPRAKSTGDVKTIIPRIASLASPRQNKPHQSSGLCMLVPGILSGN